MRTLIIDNYDSFTYNLFQLLAEVNGDEPVVVHNDDPDWTADELARYDNVVISPGPGRPERQVDFGICRQVIVDCELPLLGVCLGHQGLCYWLGGEVGPAPQVRHGRLSPVVHDQVDILAGVPSPFSVVRYHSLAVNRLSQDLEPIAWTRDGVLMAVRHRHRPAWGVQFHPESVCTEYGHQIVRNFADLTRRWHGSRAVRHTGPRAPMRRTAHAAPATRARLRVLARTLPLPVPAEVLFEALYGNSAHAFWLDSSLAAAEFGRFSFMGDAAGPLARIARAQVWQERITVSSTGGGTEVVHGSFFDWLDADLRSRTVEVPDLPFEFALGWVGYLGYELKAECGGQRAHHSDDPDAVMIFADRAIAIDHGAGTLHLLALAPTGDEDEATRWLDATAARVGSLSGASDAPRPEVTEAPLDDVTLRHDRALYF